ncbi:TPA: caspase family protein [Thermoplasmata archaeon]|nr:caspase family protein [Thermoplasmata archaeon]
MCEGQKFALLVGVSDYAPVCTYGDLSYSHKDAADMRSLLVDRYGWSTENIVLLQNETATAGNILDGLAWLEDMCDDCPRSTVIVFFSGHGSFFCDNHAVRNWDEPVEECIVPYDGDTQNVVDVIFDDTMAERLGMIDAARTMLILDSCYSGGFVEDVGAEGRIVLTSCGEREMCWEGMETGKVRIQNGLFTYCLLEAFAGAGDADRDGTVSVEEAGAYAIDRVRDFTPDVLPMMYDGIGGDTCL